MKTAIIHDWLTGMRGGEKCLEVFCELFPDADLYTLLHDKGSVSEAIESHDIHTSFLQNIPGLGKRYRNFLPLFPAAVEGFDLSDYDLILSSSHCVSHGVITRRDQLHICYCYTPMRYLHDMFEAYFGREKISHLKRAAVDLFADSLRSWDVGAANRPDEYIAISHYIAERIRRIYHRDSHVIHPPVDCSRFAASDTVEDFYLIVGAFAPYKRADIAIDAFNRMGRALVVIGSGQELEACREKANINIDFLGWQDEKSVAYYYSHCKALVFPGEEDFGIVPLEAQASGRPVIAYGRGGQRETIVGLDEAGERIPTGLFFNEQTADSVIDAIERFEANEHRFLPEACRAQAEKFDRPLFKSRIQSHLDGALARFS